MHYLLVADCWGRDHVVFQGERDSLEKVAARLRLQSPSLQARVCPGEIDSELALVSATWCAPYSGADLLRRCNTAALPTRSRAQRK